MDSSQTPHSNSEPASSEASSAQALGSNSRVGVTVAIVVGLYVLIAAITGLSWEEFRDEHMYRHALDPTSAPAKLVDPTSDADPHEAKVSNVCVVGLLIWKFLWHNLSESLALLRLSVFVLTLGCFALWLRIGRQVDSLGSTSSPNALSRSLLLLAFVPEFFVYSYQINGTMVTIVGALCAISLFLARTQRLKAGEPVPVLWDVLLFVMLTWIAVQSPFCLSFLPAVILTELFWRRQIPWRTSIAAVLAFIAWGAFILNTGVSMSESLSRHSVGENPVILGRLHFGNWAMFLVFWGGLFPFLGFAVPKSTPGRVVLPLITVFLLLGYLLLPRNGYAFDPAFHSLYTMILDRGVSWANLPSWAVNVGYFVLIAIGGHSFLHFCRFTWAGGLTGRFFLLITAWYMVLMLIDGFIASRLFLPGWIALLFFVERAFANQPRLFRAQLGYQVFVTAAYAIALGTKHGFLGLSSAG